MKAYNDDNRFFNLRSDVYFKHFFSVKKMLAIFLSNLWNQNVNEADITYDNTESTVLDGKKIIYDVVASVSLNGYQKEVRLNLEMQNRNYDYLSPRMDYYSSRKYSEALEKSERYDMASVESIWILGFDDIKDYVKTPTRWYEEAYLSTSEGIVLNEHRRVSMIFLKNKDKCPIIELRKMLEFFDIDNKNNLPVVESQEMKEKEALNMLLNMNKDRALRAEAFSREIFALDQNSQLYEAEQKGVEKGKAEGKAEGIPQGKAEGIAQGKAEGIQEGQINEKLAIAKTLYSLGQTKEFIAKATGLSLDELDNILK